MQHSFFTGDDVAYFGLAADKQSIIGSDGKDYTDWRELARLGGRHLISDIDMALAHLLRQRAPIGIVANRRQLIVKLQLGRVELVSMERFGYDRSDISTAAYMARAAADLRCWLSQNGWRLRTSLGSTGLYDVLPIFLQERRVGRAAIWLQAWRSEMVAGLCLAGREHAEAGAYKAYCYDVQSAYGACAVDTPLPYPPKMRLDSFIPPKQTAWYLNRRAGAAMATITLPEDRYGLLPERRTDGLHWHREGGEVRGVYTLNELRYAAECGARITLEWALHSSKQGAYLSEFAQACYEEKRAAEDIGDRAGRRFWKLLINATIGRLSATGGIYRAELMRYGERPQVPPPHPYSGYIVAEPYVLRTQPINIPGGSNRLWNAIIVSEQRCRMHRAASRYGALYIDTDAMVCEREASDLDIGPRMGQWAEKGHGSIHIRGPKIYAAQWDRPKARGIPAAVASSFVAGESIEFSRRRSWRVSPGEDEQVRVRAINWEA